MRLLYHGAFRGHHAAETGAGNGAGVKSEEKNRILLQINNAIITNLTQQALLHSISEALHPVFPFDRCAITLYQPERDSFRFLAVEGDLHSDYFQMGLEFSRDETCGSWVFEHLRPLVRRDLGKEQQYANERRLVAEGIQSMCVVPLAPQGKCIGLLSFGKPGKGSVFGSTGMPVFLRGSGEPRSHWRFRIRAVLTREIDGPEG